MYDVKFTGPHDAPKEISVVDGEYKVNIEREDPYGFLALSLTKKGKSIPLPEDYEGCKYTLADVALKAANKLLEELK